jgi:hypothetical protein
MRTESMELRPQDDISDTGFPLTPDEEEELSTALEDIRNGNYEDGRELLRELRYLSESSRQNPPTPS